MNIAWLGEAACHDLESVGGKAANLSRLAADHTVPPGFCLTTDAFKASLDGQHSIVPTLPEQIAIELERACAKLASRSHEPFSVAVRSSAVDEDGFGDSFAGQHDTYLNVTCNEGVKSAVQRCWESAFSNQALAYRKERGLSSEDVQLAVLVQQLVRADTSAVVFSTNPITGSEDEVVITASWGLGESVVGGSVTPDTIILRKSDLRLVSQQIGEKERMTVSLADGTNEVKVPRLMQSQPAISNEQALEMARLALDLERKMGWPVDIECAYQGDQLYLLQCRPVTTAPAPQQSEGSLLPLPEGFPVTWANPEDEKQEWMFDPMHFPRPLKPLELDTMTIFGGLTRAFAHYGVPLEMKTQVFNRYIYGAAVPTLPAEQMATQGKRAEEELKTTVLRIDELWQEEWLPEIQELLERWDSFDLGGATMPELLKHMDENMEWARDMWFVHFRITEPSYLSMGLFQELYEDLFEDDGPFAAMTLLQGFNNKTVETGHALWDLSREVRDSPELVRVFRSVPTKDVLSTLESLPEAQPFLRAFRSYLAKYGQRGDLWGMTDPSWIEDPTPAIENLKDNLEHPNRDPRAELATLAEERERAVAVALKRLESYPTPVVESFELHLKAAQTGLVLSEDHGFWIDVAVVYRVRRVFMEIGRRLAVSGVIKSADDIFYLRLSELPEMAAALPKGDRRAVVSNRKAELARFELLTPPGSLGTEQGPPPESPLSRTNQLFFGDPPPQSDDPSVLLGNAGSPGKVQGRARVLWSISDSAKLQPGEILVSMTTSPAWTPLFATAAAVVTNTGGILSHCAVVAREYAIPAVVGTGNATDVIKDGQLLEVDGEAGTVRIL
jgi:rifampicin phosphotransferase